jgi:hypothetical protein
MSKQNAWPGPHMPDMGTQAFPGSLFDAQQEALGLRFGWLKSYICPCSYAGGTPGSPNPRCNTCGGRGIYWSPSPLDFRATLTFMHTSAAPDEPGAVTYENLGHVLHAEPVITIAHSGPLNEETVWKYASSFDCFCEFDALTRFNSTLVVSDLPSSQVLPYQFGVEVLSVVAYDTVSNIIVPVPSSAWTYGNGVVTLSSAYSEGTAYTVEYMAVPILVAYRKAGGIPHARPFASGESKVPRRMHLTLLEPWLRARGGGELPAFGVVPGGA